jgi:hypothetical protein
LGAAIFLAALATASASRASNANWGYVSYITTTDDGYTYFQLSGARTSPLPSCANPAQPQRWAFNAATPAGQARLATLLSAFGLHKQIYIYGTGACNDATEILSFFHTGE